jgi:hypothetical protein
VFFIKYKLLLIDVLESMGKERVMGKEKEKEKLV